MKKTFENLSEEKQDLIKKVGERLFSKYRFEEITVKMIVDEADIPRGSFYAYFEDLEDYYLFVLKEMQESRISLISLLMDHCDYDYFSFFELLFSNEVRDLNNKGKNPLLEHYYYYLANNRANTIDSRNNVEPRIIEAIQKLYPSLELKDHTISHDDLTEMIMNVYIQTYLKTKESSLTDVGASKLFRTKLNIIKEGIKHI